MIKTKQKLFRIEVIALLIRLCGKIVEKKKSKLPLNLQN